MIPADAQYLHGGLYYKQGAHDFVYKWTGWEWTRASKRWAVILRSPTAMNLQGGV